MSQLTIRTWKAKSAGVRFSYHDGTQEVGRAFLYVLYNNLHDAPFGLLEDLFVHEDFRNRGVGSKIVTEVVREAKRQNCYKIIATSRFARTEAHAFYKKIGFAEYGKEFRMDL